VTAGDSDDEEKLDASVLLQRLQGDYDDVVCVSSDQVHGSQCKFLIFKFY